MRIWTLRPGDPIGLRLSADIAGGGSLPFHDFVWDLGLKDGDPPALALRSGYGGPGREVRIFPMFRWGERTAMDPERFASPPVVRAFLPSYLRVDFKPFPELAVKAEFWIPRSDTAACRLQLENRAPEPRSIHLGILVTLATEGGAAFAGSQREGARILESQLGDLAPVVFLTGGASFEEHPYPSLSIEADLGTGASRRWTWVHSAVEDGTRSFALARETARLAWDAAISKSERAHGGMVEITTGDPAWDAVIAQSQTEALRAFVGEVRSFPHPVFVSSRKEDRGFSARGDGKDFGPEWAGQNLWSAWSLANLVLPSAPHLAKGVVRNLLSIQDGQGRVDAGADLAGRPAGALCPPLLANLAWRVYEATQDRVFLQDVLPKLLEFADSWFSLLQDRDGDGWPEWDSFLQAGLGKVPGFVPWQPLGLGGDMSTMETVDLASYLYAELGALLEMAKIEGASDRAALLQGRRSVLRRSVEEMWRIESSLYRHRDRDTHLSSPGLAMGNKKGEGELRIRRALPIPSRILVACQGPEAAASRIEVELVGRGPDGSSLEEVLRSEAFQWFWDSGKAVSEGIFARLERVRIRGVGDPFHTEVRTVDLSREDAGQLLPLWAGIPDPIRREEAVRRTLLDPKRFWRTYGIPSCSAADPAYVPGNVEAGSGSFFWNGLLAESLAGGGFRAEAAELVQRMMSGVIQTLVTHGEFREALDPEAGVGVGVGPHVCGLFPVFLFLEVLGVRFLGRRKVRLEGTNPFPWPVEVRWRGLRVRRESGSTRITFPDGEEAVIPYAEAQVLVEQERDVRDRLL